MVANEMQVQVWWDERQQYMPGHVARRVAYSNVSRNLVLRFVKPCMTADALREDLAHIHRLEIIDILFDNGHAFISTNSIQHAMTARTCMLSRFKYKNIQIEFYPDECDVPLPVISGKYTKKPSLVKAATLQNCNRFQPLCKESEDMGDHDH